MRLIASRLPVRREHQIVFDMTISRLVSPMKSLFRNTIALMAKGKVIRQTRV